MNHQHTSVIDPSGVSRREMLRLSAGSLFALGLWPGALRADGKANAGEFTFIAVNDLHFHTTRCSEWFERVVKQMKATDPKPALCLIVGDFAELGTPEEINSARDAFKPLGIPTWQVIGNHDYLTQTDRRAYEKAFPNRFNYRFEYEGWQFVGLDSSEGKKSSGTKIQPETLRWVDDNLAKLDRIKPLVIFTHFPLGIFTPMRPSNADDLLVRFKDHNLQAVFNGHFHGFSERPYGQATITTNRCCAISRKNHDGTPEKGYFLCSAKDGRITREFVEVKPA